VLLRELVLTYARVSGEESSVALHCCGTLGSCLLASRRIDEAEAIFRRTMPTMRRVLGAEHADTRALAQALEMIELNTLRPALSGRRKPRKPASAAPQSEARAIDREEAEARAAAAEAELMAMLEREGPAAPRHDGPKGKTSSKGKKKCT
jgi:hypothetical protein